MDGDQPLNNLTENLQHIKEIARTYYHDDDLHGWGHVLRVLENARRLHAVEGGEWVIIETLVWLHDVGRKLEKTEGKHHALLSANLAAEFLETLSIDPKLISTIVEGIMSHSFSIGGKPSTLEAKILSDADKLDAIGAIGIYRACAYQVQHGLGIQAVLDHFEEKLLILDQKMYLPAALSIAKKRIERLLQFQKDLLEENPALRK